MAFSTLAEFQSVLADVPAADEAAREGARTRNAQLTKPAGSLGRLEEIAAWYAGWRGDAQPRVEAPQVVVFAGNHGVTARGVSAFPVEVTVQMVANFEHGGRQSISCLEMRVQKCRFTRLILTARREISPRPSQWMRLIGVAALKTGWNAVDASADLLVVGEMGIGNTTSAAAIANALFGGTAQDWVGRGTGVDDAGLKIKQDVVSAGVALHGGKAPLDILASLGGRELAAMAGAIARARVLRIPVILDGFICTAAAATLERAVTGALDHCLAGHLSEEAAHGRVLAVLGKEPLLSLGLRLGEGSGAALAIPLVRAALECHSGMATFAEAGVSGA